MRSVNSFSEVYCDFGDSHHENIYNTLLSSIVDASDTVDSTCKHVYQASIDIGNIALSETQLINHLCTCNNELFKWCFIHSKVSHTPGSHIRGNEFGFIPLCQIEYPLFRPSNNLDIEDLQHWAFMAHLTVKSRNTFNYKAARLRVPTELHVDHWRALCGNYHDQKILEYLEFGFPLCIDRSRFVFNENHHNHPSADQYPSDVTAYFNKEVKHKAIVGPCT